MLDLIINEYIKKLSNNDIIVFAKYNQIILNENEATLFKNIIKRNWRTILYGNPTDLFKEIRENTNEETYNKSIKLFNAIQEKFKR